MEYLLSAPTHIMEQNRFPNTILHSPKRSKATAVSVPQVGIGWFDLCMCTCIYRIQYIMMPPELTMYTELHPL